MAWKYHTASGRSDSNGAGVFRTFLLGGGCLAGLLAPFCHAAVADDTLYDHSTTVDALTNTIVNSSGTYITSSDIDLSNNATLTVEGNGTSTYSGVVRDLKDSNSKGSLIFTSNPSGSVFEQILTADQTYKGSTTITGATLTFGDGHTAGSVAGDISINNSDAGVQGALSINRTDNLTLSQTITGAGDLNQNGIGRTTLSGDDSGFTGKIAVNRGQLEVTNNLGSSQVTVASGAMLGIGALPQPFFPGASLGSLIAVSGSTSGSVAGDIVDNGTVVIGHSNDITLSNNITGTGSLLQNGSGTTTISGSPKTYSGTTQINNGTLKLSGDGTTSGTLSNTSNIVINAGTRSGSPVGVLAVDYSGDATLKAPITGGGHLDQIGTGNLTIDRNDNNFNGIVNVKNGTFTLGKGGVLGGQIYNYATTNIDGGTMTHNPHPIFNYKTLTSDNGATLSTVYNYGTATLNNTTVTTTLTSGQDPSGVSKPDVVLNNSTVGAGFGAFLGGLSVNSGTLESNNSDLHVSVNIASGAQATFSNNSTLSGLGVTNLGTMNVDNSSVTPMNVFENAGALSSNNGTLGNVNNDSGAKADLTGGTVQSFVNKGTLTSQSNTVFTKLTNGSVQDKAAGNATLTDSKVESALENYGTLTTKNTTLADLTNDAPSTAQLTGGTVQAVNNLGSLTTDQTKLATLKNVANATASLSGGTVQSATNEGTLTSQSGTVFGQLSNGDAQDKVAGNATLTDSMVKSALENYGTLTTKNTTLADLTNDAPSTAQLTGGTAQAVNNLGGLTTNQTTLATLKNASNATAALSGGGVQGGVDNSGSLTATGVALQDVTNETANGSTTATLTNSTARNLTNSENAALSVSGGSAQSVTNNGTANFSDGSIVKGDTLNDGSNNHSKEPVLTGNGAQFNNITNNDAQLTLTNSTAGAVKNSDDTATLGGKLSEVDVSGGKLASLSNDVGVAKLSNQTQVTGLTTNERGGTLTATNAILQDVNNTANLTASGGSQANLTNSGSGQATLQDGNTTTGNVYQQGQSLTMDGNTVTGTVSVDTGKTLTVGSKGASIGSLAATDATGILATGGTLKITGGYGLNSDTAGVEKAGYYGGSLTGSGGVTVTGGTEIFNGTNTYQGDTNVQNATLQLGTGGTTGSVDSGSTINLGQNGTLDINRSDSDLHIGSNLTAADNTGTVNINGAGAQTTTFDGDTSNFHGTANISHGDMYVTQKGFGGTGSQLNLESGGKLSGASGATIGGNVTVDNGTLAAGDIVNQVAGTLTINGNLTMNSNSSLLFSNLLSKLNVEGTATLNMNASNGRPVINIDNLERDVKIGTIYTILYAKDGVKGTNVNQQLATSNPNVTVELYSSGKQASVNANVDVNVDVNLDVKLAHTQNSFQNALPISGGNAGSAARATDILASNSNIASSGLVTALTYQVPRTDMKRVMDNLSGEIHASVRTALIQDSFMLRNAVLNRLDNSDCAFGRNGQSTYDMKTHRKNDASCASDHVMLWGQAYGSLGSNSATGEAAAMHHNTAGFVMGMDAPIRGTNWRAGGLVSYGHSMFNVGDGRSSSGSSNNITVGGYAGTHWGRLNLRLGATYSWNVINTRRQIAVGSYGGRVNSSYLGGTAQGFAELGYKMHAGRSVFEPFANVAYVNMHTNGYRERGNDAALRGRGQDNGVTFSTFGFRAATQLNIGKMAFAPHLSAAYRHAFGVTGSKVHQAFMGEDASATSFGVNGVLLSNNAAVVETGVTAHLTKRVDLDLSYVGQYGNRSVDSGATGSFRMSF